MCNVNLLIMLLAGYYVVGLVLKKTFKTVITGVNHVRIHYRHYCVTGTSYYICKSLQKEKVCKRKSFLIHG